MKNPFMDEHSRLKMFFFFSLEKVLLFFVFDFWTFYHGPAAYMHASKLSVGSFCLFSIYLFSIFMSVKKMLHGTKHLIKNLLGTIPSFITLIYNFLCPRSGILCPFFSLSFLLCLNFPMCYDATWVHKNKRFLHGIFEYNRRQIDTREKRVTGCE